MRLLSMGYIAYEKGIIIPNNFEGAFRVAIYITKILKFFVSTAFANSFLSINFTCLIADRALAII